MASVSNGNGKWVFWVCGTLVMALMTLSGYVVANDKDSRMRDDKEMAARISEDKALRQEIVLACTVQSAANADLMRKMERALTKLEYIEQKIR